MRRCPWLVAVILVLNGAGPAHARVDPTAALGFERGNGPGVLEQWNGVPSGPPATLSLDSTVVHSGRYSGRIERTVTSAATFSSFAFSLPVDFRGRQLELRGWIKYQGVVGTVGLWQRQDGRNGMRQFDNMAQRRLTGTSDWQEVRLSLPLDSLTRTVTVGSLLSGTGRLWADDLALFVDDVPLARAPAYTPPLTILERDTTFTSGSRVRLPALTPRRVDDLVLLARVWGFLKYHHPDVVAGRRQWDFDLFRVLPAVLAARDREQATRTIARWVASVGEPPPCRNCAHPPTADAEAPRLGWLSDRARLGRELSEQLLRVHARRSAVTEQFFVGQFPGVGNPDFTNELAYPEQRDPDPGYRLLALFRYWNIIEYWFPYRDTIGTDWEGVLRESVPRFAAAEGRAAYCRELVRLIARVHDTHANLWSALDAVPPPGNAMLPVSVRFLEGQAVVTGFTNPRLGAASGLRVGDVIEALDGARVDSLLEQWRPMFAVSNEAAFRRDVARSLTRGAPGDVRVSLRRGGTALEVTAVRVVGDSLDRGRDWRHDHEGATLQRLSGDVAYLKLSSVKAAEVNDYLARAAGARCLVVDLRNYPSEFVVFALGNHLVNAPSPFVRFSAADLANPGAFAMGPALSLEPAAPAFEGQVAILVDEVTQSQAEYTAMAFRSRPGTIVVGSQTAGADGNVSNIPLPGGQRTMISGIGVFYPDLRPTQRVGIVPDLEVRPTIKGMLAGRDELLEAAVRRLLGRELTPAEASRLGAAPSARP